MFRGRRNDDGGFGLDTRFGGSSATENKCIPTSYEVMSKVNGPESTLVRSPGSKVTRFTDPPHLPGLKIDVSGNGVPIHNRCVDRNSFRGKSVFRFIIGVLVVRRSPGSACAGAGVRGPCAQRRRLPWPSLLQPPPPTLSRAASSWFSPPDAAPQSPGGRSPPSASSGSPTTAVPVTHTHTTLLSFSAQRGSGGAAATTLGHHRDELGSLTSGVAPGFREWELCWVMPLVSGFPPGSPVSPTHAFRRSTVSTSFTRIASQNLVGLTLLTAAQTSPLHRRVWSNAGMKGRGKQEIPKKTRRPAAASGTIPGIDPPGIKPTSPSWKMSTLSATPARFPMRASHSAFHVARTRLLLLALISEHGVQLVHEVHHPFLRDLQRTLRLQVLLPQLSQLYLLVLYRLCGLRQEQVDPLLLISDLLEVALQISHKVSSPRSRASIVFRFSVSLLNCNELHLCLCLLILSARCCCPQHLVLDHELRHLVYLYMEALPQHVRLFLKLACLWLYVDVPEAVACAGPVEILFREALCVDLDQRLLLQAAAVVRRRTEAHVCFAAGAGPGPRYALYLLLEDLVLPGDALHIRLQLAHDPLQVVAPLRVALARPQEVHDGVGDLLHAVQLLEDCLVLGHRAALVDHMPAALQLHMRLTEITFFYYMLASLPVVVACGAVASSGGAERPAGSSPTLLAPGCPRYRSSLSTTPGKLQPSHEDAPGKIQASWGASDEEPGHQLLHDRSSIAATSQLVANGVAHRPVGK
ncbi:hypothetical protein PR048_025964 [Dryococelus australis]|uniref:Uncharacterized protein n=1 Tax=Dryococelus australis TaxID=614101 RepID=A0ABQ9GK07_9NEOP|nr:hypothetical protein PR048_025964 [Dryococelus australis]